MRGAPLQIGSLTLARAFGRDSGARLGDGVAHLAGPKPRSGGSVKNWRTVIPGGCLLAVYNVPRAMAASALADDRHYCAIGDGTEATPAILARLQHDAAVATMAGLERAVRTAWASRHNDRLPRTTRHTILANAVRDLREARESALATAGV